LKYNGILIEILKSTDLKLFVVVRNYVNITKSAGLVQFLIKIGIQLLMMDTWMNSARRVEITMIKKSITGEENETGEIAGYYR
jgi:hypothetical protein